MKMKFFILIVLFLGIGAVSVAQSQSSSPSATKDAPTQVAAPDQAKSVECAGHQTTGAKADCKWVDANSDGKCDLCGKTEKECNEACKPAAASKSGCAASCQYHKECGKSMGSSSSKDGKKNE